MSRKSGQTGRRSTAPGASCYESQKMKRLLPLLAVGVVLALASGLVITFGAPRLESSFPSAGSGEHPAVAPLQLTFSQPMQAESLQARLEIRPEVQGTYTWSDKTLTFTPKNGWPARTKVIVRLAAGARAAELLPLAMRQDFELTFQTSSPRLAYLFPSGEAADLYAIQPDSGLVERLTDLEAGVLDFSASFSPPAIFFSLTNAAGGGDLYRLDLSRLAAPPASQDAPAPMELLLACPEADCRLPQVSPGGDMLAFEKTVSSASGGLGIPQVWLADLDEQGRLASEPTLAGEATHQTILGAWSMDGKLMFYDSDASAFTLFTPGVGIQARFANQNGEPGSWLPSGKAFVAPETFFVKPTSAGPKSSVTAGTETLFATSHLFLHNLADGSSLDLSGAADLEDQTPVFSPDGSQLAFARRALSLAKWSKGMQIWVRPFAKDAPSADAIQLTNAPNFTHLDFAWSPDSQRLAYVRFNQTTFTEAPEIWLMDLRGARSTLLLSNGFSPRWIP